MFYLLLSLFLYSKSMGLASCTLSSVLSSGTAAWAWAEIPQGILLPWGRWLFKLGHRDMIPQCYLPKALLWWASRFDSHQTWLGSQAADGQVWEGKKVFPVTKKPQETSLTCSKRVKCVREPMVPKKRAVLSTYICILLRRHIIIAHLHLDMLLGPGTSLERLCLSLTPAYIVWHQLTLFRSVLQLLNAIFALAPPLPSVSTGTIYHT